MHSVPTREPSLSSLVLLGCFVAGPGLGIALGRHLAQGSDVAQLLSIWVFPLSFFAGLCLWFGVGVIRVVLGTLWNLLRGRLRESAPAPDEALVPPGYGAFVPLCISGASFAGVVTALATATPWLVALPLYAGAGAAYGYALRTLAHHGFLPFPEPE